MGSGLVRVGILEPWGGLRDPLRRTRQLGDRFAALVRGRRFYIVFQTFQTLLEFHDALTQPSAKFRQLPRAENEQGNDPHNQPVLRAIKQRQWDHHDTYLTLAGNVIGRPDILKLHAFTSSVKPGPPAR